MPAWCPLPDSWCPLPETSETGKCPLSPLPAMSLPAMPVARCKCPPHITNKHISAALILSIGVGHWFSFLSLFAKQTNFQNKILFLVPKYERFGPLGVRQVKARTARGSLKRSSDRSKTEKTYVRTTLVGMNTFCAYCTFSSNVCNIVSMFMDNASQVPW